MTGKTKYLSVFAGLALVGLVSAGIRHREAPSATLTMDQPATPSVPKNQRSSSPGFATMDPVSNDVVDPNDWVQNGPKEPLVPNEIQIEAELAPGSVLTAEPLVPKELHLDTELAPGETLNKAPLTPHEIRADGAAR